MNNNLLNLLTGLYMETPENVIGVSMSYKMKNNIKTDEISIRFEVLEKKPLNQLLSGERLPTGIEYNGIMYPTDVVQEELPMALACYNWQGSCESNIGCPNEIFAHRSRTRPLKGGVVISNFTDLYDVFSPFSLPRGTLGAIVVDNDDQTLVGLTNNHVIIRDAFAPSVQNLEVGLNINISNKKNIIQYSETGQVFVDLDSIGSIKKYFPMSDTPQFNFVDAAVISIDKANINGEPIIDETESFKQLQLDYNSPMPFATSQEINSLLVNQYPIYSAGRTTGPKGTVNCQLVITSLTGVGLVGGYNKKDNETVNNRNDTIVVGSNVLFADMIEFKNADNSLYPIAGGDSGSTLIADINGVWKIVGLVFAGSPTRGLACRIDRVAQSLNLTGWDGSPKRFTSNDSLALINDSFLSSVTKMNPNTNDVSQWQVTGVQNNQKYWFAGLMKPQDWNNYLSSSSSSSVYDSYIKNWSANNMVYARDWSAGIKVNDRWIVVAENSISGAVSAEGINWFPSILPFTGNWSCLATGFLSQAPPNPPLGVVYALARNNASGAVTTDGVNWVPANVGSAFDWHSIAYHYGSSGFIVGYGGYKSMVWGQDKLVAAVDDNNGQFLSYSPVLGTWINTPAPYTGRWKCVAFGQGPTFPSGRFVVIATDSNKAGYSNDGITWYKSLLPVTGKWNSVIYGDRGFFAVGSGVGAVSTDGISWFPFNPSANREWTSVVHGKVLGIDNYNYSIYTALAKNSISGGILIS